MSYLALYRRYRPRTFHEVLGQEVITKTLLNQIKSGKFAHAYLFCGSRGTGKTSTAKILARAINCVHPVEGEPCGQCEICTMNDAELSSDIIEIDAASNNGVDEIRELRDKVRYGPAIAKFKVYIIDEVHMLSQGAFNALLKTLEEPPAHAVFILATTEMHRLPATIVSRCQRFDFQQMSERTIVEHMQRILQEMQRSCDEDALWQIARAAEGGMRDALSLLDQCLMVSERLTIEDVYRVIGFVGGQSVFAFLSAMEAQDVAKMLSVIEEVSQSGANLEVFVRECMQELRNRLVQEDKEHRFRYCDAMEVLANLQTQMRYAPRPRVLLDAAAVRLCLPQAENTISSLMARVEALENKLSKVAAQPDTEPLANTSLRSSIPQKPVVQKAPSDVPPWEEETGPPPFEEAPPETEEMGVPMHPPLHRKTKSEPQAKQTMAPPKTAAAPVIKGGDLKASFFAEMGKVSAGVSQSIRLSREVVRIGDIVYIVFGSKDAIFVNALGQHQQDLNRIAASICGEGVQAKAITEDQLPKKPIDEQEVAQKVQAIFGIPVEIENS